MSRGLSLPYIRGLTLPSSIHNSLDRRGPVDRSVEIRQQHVNACTGLAPATNAADSRERHSSRMWNPPLMRRSV